MTTNPDVLRLARSIAAHALCGPEKWKPGVKAGMYEDIMRGLADTEALVQAAIAAIERTTELSRDFVNYNLAPNGKTHSIAWHIERYAHLRQPEKDKSQAKSSEVSNCSCGGPCSRCLNKCQCSACCHTT